MLVTSCGSMLVWNYTYQAEPNNSWRPISDILGMMFLVPIGWLFSFITIPGWVSILFLCLSVYKQLPYILLGSAAATVFSGIWWPMFMCR